MISDALFEASEEIRYYLREAPHVYAEIRPRLDRLVSEIDAVRKELDTPPKADQ